MAMDLNVTCGDAEVSMRVSGSYSPDVLDDMTRRAVLLLMAADSMRTEPAPDPMPETT